MGSESDYWRTPPTESEQSEIQVRRQRRDRSSQLMGEYLLKGYCMTAKNCPKCSEVIFDDKRGRVFCVGCDEVDKEFASSSASSSDTVKVVDHNGSSIDHNSITEKSTVSKSTTNQSSAPAVNGTTTSSSSTLSTEHDDDEKRFAASAIAASAAASSSDSISSILGEARTILAEKLRSAAKRLESEETPSACIDFANMIKSCAEAMTAVNKAMMK